MEPADRHLDDDQLAELRAELEAQRERLVESMRVTEAVLDPVELDPCRVGRLSRMDELQNQSLAKNLREREGLRLALIDEALGRLSAGTYGRCRECGAPIAFDRLFVYPEAPSCAACGLRFRNASILFSCTAAGSTSCEQVTGTPPS